MAKAEITKLVKDLTLMPLKFVISFYCDDKYDVYDTILADFLLACNFTFQQVHFIRG